MENLIGRKVKLTMNHQIGIIVVTGELLKIIPPFLVLKVGKKETYFSMYYIKTIEEA